MGTHMIKNTVCSSTIYKQFDIFVKKLNLS